MDIEVTYKELNALANRVQKLRQFLSVIAANEIPNESLSKEHMNAVADTGFLLMEITHELIK